MRLRGFVFLTVYFGLFWCVSGQKSIPKTIESVFNTFFQDMVYHYPEVGTRLGVSGNMAPRFRQDKLNDESREAETAYYSLLRNYQIDLKSYMEDKLTGSQILSRDILLRYIRYILEGEPFRDHPYVLNPRFGFHNNLTSMMTEYHNLNTEQDVRDYICRLQGYPQKLKQLEKRIGSRSAKGLLAPVFIVAEMETLIKDFINPKAEDNVLYTSFKRRLRGLMTIDKGQKQKWLDQVKGIIDSYVKPSYRKMLQQIHRLKDSIGKDAGVWRLPHGEAYYQYCLSYHTTTRLKPEEVHQIGLREVKRIQDEMRLILKELGIKKTKYFYEMINLYWRELQKTRSEKFYFAHTGDNRHLVIQEYGKLVKFLQKKIPDCFSLIPRATVEVLPVPEFKKRTTGPHYSPATLDQKHPGVFYVNNSYLPPKKGMKTLTCHEAIPGHHFQFAIQKESSDNRLFRNLFFFTAYVEGWALYAEKLAQEYNWFTDVHERLSYLNSELLRATRLVLDTGIHYKKWSREQAYRYMVYCLGWGSYVSIDRYIVWPGQACAYKIGELKILQLRSRAQKSLGTKFDIKEFHRVVLQHGSVPLDILDRLVTEYINKRTHK